MKILHAMLSLGFFCWASSCLGQDDVLSGTQRLTQQGDLSAQMVAGIDQFLLRQIDAKFGPGAKFTDNQKVGYPEIGNTGGKIVGGKLEGQGLPAGSKIEPMDVLVDWW